ncbi:MAG: YcxB family protein, partial [Lachnospiraceae bacterium]|nr:YcxB family protein [Lachnospiraceae bacterium]
MEPLYTTESCMTQDEYLKFNDAVIKSNKLNRILVPAFTAVMIILGIFRMVQGRIGIGLYFIILALLFNIFLGYSTKRRAIRTWQASKALQNRRVRYYFYEDHLESEVLGNSTEPVSDVQPGQNPAAGGTVPQDKYGESAAQNTDRKGVRYDELYRVLETPTNFYILTSAGQGIVIQKEACEEGLISLIQ